jgi:hypothetical protein
MTRKKSNLWLHKAKATRQHKDRHYPSVAWSEALMNVMFIKSPAKESNLTGKHNITPLKDLAPKRRKLNVPLTLENMLSPFQDVEDEVLIDLEQIENSNHDNDESLPQLQEFGDENCCEEDDVVIFRRVISKLQACGQATDLSNFLTLVDLEKFPLDNSSFLLFLETVRFMSTNITSEMKYGKTTKRFWKTGYRLLHAKLLYFMGGPRNIGKITTGVAQPGMLTSEKSKINFAVPSTNVISDFNISEVQVPNVVPPGVLEQIIRTLRESGDENEYMLCADGKQVTSGIDSKGGDVDMFGHEGVQTLTERKQKLNRNLALIKEVKERLQNSKTDEFNRIDRDMEESVVSDLKNVVSLLSNTIKEGRQKQAFGFKEV